MGPATRCRVGSVSVSRDHRGRVRCTPVPLHPQDVAALEVHTNMALTDTRPEAGTTSVAPSAAPGPVSIIGSADHKAIGLVWIVASLVFGVASLVVTALWMAHSASESFLTSTTAQTLEGASWVGIVLLSVIPLLLGIATYVVPLQVGANTVAFPRAAAAALWAWLLSGGVFVVSQCIGGGAGGDREKALALAILSVIGLVVAIVVATTCVLTTAIALRTPGMTLDLVPTTTWAFVVGGSIWVLTLPVLFAQSLLSWVDLRWGGGTTWGTAEGWYLGLRWLVAQPQDFALVIPALGIAIDVLVSSAGVRLPKRHVVNTILGVLGVLAVGAYTVPTLFPDAGDNWFWQIASVVILLPILALLGGVAQALRAGGKPSLRSPVALSGLVLLFTLLAGLTSALLAITPLELRVDGSFQIGQFAFALTAALLGAIAGVLWWSPKMTGRIGTDGPGKLAVLLLLAGGGISGLALCILGFEAKVSAIGDAQTALISIAVIGAALTALGVLLGLVGLAASMRSGSDADDDAWGVGQTLEWACPSPPPSGNFGTLAPVVSAEPLLDAKEA